MSKVIVITGAGVGLGRALARRFATDGDNVVLLGRTLAKVEAVAKEIGAKALAVACDVGDIGSVKEAFATIAKTHPKIDVLINNAAIYEPTLIADASDKQILQAVNTNLLGPILCTRAALAVMERGGQIINVSSESVGISPFPHLLLYQATKAGLDRFSEGLYHELQPFGIRVTNVSAGSMIDMEKTMEFADPGAWQRFHHAAGAAGINLRERPISQVKSVTDVFRAVIDMPPDVLMQNIQVHAWKP